MTVVIPSLDPDEHLLHTIRGVQEKGFSDILLVDDGSAENNQHYFTEAEQNMGCTVLHHPKNFGKVELMSMWGFPAVLANWNYRSLKIY